MKRKSSRSRRSERRDYAVEERPSAAQQEYYHYNRHRDVNCVQYHCRRAHFGHELGNLRSGRFLFHKVYRRGIGIGQHRKHEHKHAHAAYPVRKTAQKQHAVRKLRRRVVDYRHTGGRKARNDLEQRVEIGLNLSAYKQRKRADKRHYYPGKTGGNKSVARVHFGFGCLNGTQSFAERRGKDYYSAVSEVYAHAFAVHERNRKRHYKKTG